MSLNNLSDEELMVLYQSGAEDAFEVMYGRHSSKIYGFLRSRVRNDERAAELFQEVFLKIHRSKYLYDKSLPVLPWIFSVTRSVLIDGLRIDKKAKRDAEYARDLPENDKEDNQANEPSNAHQLDGLLGRLPENQRVAMELRYVDEKTFDEVAARLNTSAINVRKIISRAVAKLKSLASEGDKS